MGHAVLCLASLWSAGPTFAAQIGIVSTSNLGHSMSQLESLDGLICVSATEATLHAKPRAACSSGTEVCLPQQDGAGHSDPGKWFCESWARGSILFCSDLHLPGLPSGTGGHTCSPSNLLVIVS